MRPLFARFPGLEARCPALDLATLPTRVHRLEAVSKATGAEVWIKRDDETHRTLGGSKIRALEFLLPPMKAAGRPVIACGPEGSGWLLALARFATPHGLDLRLLTFPSGDNPVSRRKAELIRAEAGGRLRASRGVLGFGLRVLGAGARVAFGRADFAPAGGSDAVSTAGYVNAALEFAAQVERKECPAPDAVFVPVGSGGLAAGLAAGFALANLRTTICAVSVAPRFFAGKGRILRLALQAAWAVDWKDPAFADLRVLHAYKGKYGVPTPAGTAAAGLFAREEKVELDPTFSAKAAAALLAEAPAWHGRPVLFWLTYRPPHPA